MRTWNIPLGISTCRSATCTPHRIRWIRSPSVANAFRECGRTTIRHDTTTLGGGRYHPQGRRQVLRTLLRFAHLGPTQSASRNRALSHGRTRWASRSMRSLWASGHLLQLLPKPALSEVPDQRQGEVVVRPATGADSSKAEIRLSNSTPLPFCAAFSLGAGSFLVVPPFEAACCDRAPFWIAGGRVSAFPVRAG